MLSVADDHKGRSFLDEWNHCVRLIGALVHLEVAHVWVVYAIRLGEIRDFVSWLIKLLLWLLFVIKVKKRVSEFLLSRFINSIGSLKVITWITVTHIELQFIYLLLDVEKYFFYLQSVSSKDFWKICDVRFQICNVRYVRFSIFKIFNMHFPL